MRSLLLSPLSWRITVGACISFVLVFALGIVALLRSQSDWLEAESAYKKLDSSQRAQCERWFAQAEAEFMNIEKDRCPHTNDGDKDLGCYFANINRKQDLLENASNGKCPSVTFGFGKFPMLAKPHATGPMIEFALRSIFEHLLPLSVSFVVLTALFVFLTDVGRRVVVDSHVGWKRLLLVLPTLTALLAFGWQWSEDGVSGRAFTSGLAALVLSPVAMIYGRIVFLWVAAGFSSSPRSVQIAPAQLARSLVVVAPPAADIVEPLTTPSTSETIDVAPALETEADAPPTPLATFWPRFWARCVDLPLCWFLGSIFGVFLPDLRVLADGLGGIVLELLAGMIVIGLVVFAYEVLFVSSFGATPGKMLFGLSVQSTDNLQPTFAESKTRAMIYLKYGLCFTFFLPWLQLLGAYMAWHHQNVVRPWDLASRTTVRQESIGSVRFVSAAILAFCLAAFMVGGHTALKQVTKQEVRGSVLR